MLTKEEILAKVCNHYSDILTDVILNEPAITPAECFKAMEEYKDQELRELKDKLDKQAIDFGEFIGGIGGYPYRYLKSVDKWTSQKDDLLTTRELFQKFLTEGVAKEAITNYK